MDVSISHPGATSDYLAFVTSPLRYKLETPGFLAPGLVLFGDNAYVSNEYMVTPYRNVKSGPKDAFNFFQSQLRIRIECAFGVLVYRWGILRKPMPNGISLNKTTSLVFCLCKLHNFCIDNKDSTPPPSMAQDEATISLQGGAPLESFDNGEESRENSGRPAQLLDGGDHLEDVDRRARHTGARAGTESLLPREALLQHVRLQDLQRPRPKGWRVRYNK